MTPEGKVIDCGLGPSLLTPALFACGLCPDLFTPGAMLVADPGVAAVVGVGFTMCTVGVTVGYILDTLPRHPSSKPAIAPQHPSHTPTSTFDQGFLFLPYGQHRAHLFNRRSDRPIVSRSLVSGKQTQWLDYLPSPALALVATTVFCAVAMQDGSVNVYSPTGRRCVFPYAAPCATVADSNPG